MTRAYESRYPPPHLTWRPSEQWVWQRVCEGAIADFNARDGKVLDPSNPTGWDDTRTVSAAFLATVLLQESYRRALPRRGVRIVGAWFPEVLALEDARLEHTLWLDCARFEREVQLLGLKSTHSLSLEGSCFTQSLTLSRARIEGQLVLSSAQCTSSLKLDDLEVKGSVFMLTEGDQRAQFAEIDLHNARIEGQLALRGAHCTGLLNMDGLEVRGSVFMHTEGDQRARFAEIDLRNARIGGQLVLHGVLCTGPLNLESLQVGGDVSLEGAVVAHRIRMIFARLGGNFGLARSGVPSIDLTGASLLGELRLGGAAEDSPRWAKDAQLVLRNATVGALQCPPSLEAWPALELGGCTYKQLGGFSVADPGTQMAARPPSWFVQWLEKDRTFSPYPYHQLGSMLRSMGHAETADAVLYAGKERERRAAGWRTPKRWGMSLLKWTIGYGYGYRYFRSLIWVLVITLIGALVWATTPPGRDASLVGRLAYSFDLLLPIIELDKHHSLDGIHGWPRYYFYAHELLGYVLGAFIVAGLAGITKK